MKNTPLLLALFTSGSFLVNTLSSFCQDTSRLDSSLYQSLPFPPASIQKLLDTKILPVDPVLLSTLSLPVMVDNSTSSFMPPVFEQEGASCNQAACITYNFAYEINRLRNVPASPENQYPTHFIYNFLNRGGEAAVNIIESWELMKAVGNPNVVDYGGIHPGELFNFLHSDKVWITGHSKYLNALNNKVEEYYRLDVGTAEGIESLKHYLHNHLEGSTSGGVCNFYAELITAGWNNLPADSPEAGKTCMTQLGTWVNHCMTIVGYHDSIRYDFNHDGLYTNHLDLNLDGVVDLKDWEIGGVKVMNSYGDDWADSGYYYLFYRSLATPCDSGGIWNHCVYTVKPRVSYSPIITYRIVLQHNKRNRIRLSYGFSMNLADSLPQHEWVYPLINHQGGSMGMQGPRLLKINYQGENHYGQEILDFRMDVSSMLALANTGQPIKFFFIVDEVDTDSIGEGMVHRFILTDHSLPNEEYQCLDRNVPIKNNGRTVLSITREPAFSVPGILDNCFPTANEGMAYTHDLEASGGISPYTFRLVHAFHDTLDACPIPQINTPVQAGTPIPLSFGFPLAGSVFDTVYLSPFGFLYFDPGFQPWVYLMDEELQFRETTNISVFNTKNQHTIPIELCYDMQPNRASFRWKTRHYSLQPPRYFNYSLSIFPSGKMELVYDSCEIPYGTPWFSGVSVGDNLSYHFSDLSYSASILPGTRITIEQQAYPIGMQLSKAGCFFGNPGQGYACYTLQVSVTDWQGLETRKTLSFDVLGINTVPETNKQALQVKVFPNPFSQQVFFQLEACPGTQACIEIYDLAGKHVKTIQSSSKQAIQELRWNGCNEAGYPVSPGVYLYQINTGVSTFRGKLVH